MRRYDIARQNMVSGQLRTNRVTDAGVLAAMGSMPREQYVADPFKGVAYVDEDVPLGGGRYLMEPMVFGRLLQAAAIRDSDVVLDVGAATGYSSAVIARCAAAVVALESDAALAARARGLLADGGVDNAVVVEGGLAAGHPSQAPYDVIVIEGSVEAVPDGLTRQLAEGGRLVAVVGSAGAVGKATLMLNAGGVVSGRVLFEAAIEPLSGFARAPAFVF
ncbi:MAG: protein-L-isoaspartate O-methyltransferase [Alphaproteobacteria bacterium]|nr:protein-L-isoaspartate O-methyltransferase [Alphaproteobacteria bacterium]